MSANGDLGVPGFSHRTVFSDLIGQPQEPTRHQDPQPRIRTVFSDMLD